MLVISNGDFICFYIYPEHFTENKDKYFVSGVYENPDHEMNGMEHYIQTDTCLIIKVYI